MFDVHMLKGSNLINIVLVHLCLVPRYFRVLLWRRIHRVGVCVCVTKRGQMLMGGIVFPVGAHQWMCMCIMVCNQEPFGT